MAGTGRRTTAMTMKCSRVADIDIVACPRGGVVGAASGHPLAGQDLRARGPKIGDREGVRAGG